MFHLLHCVAFVLAIPINTNMSSHLSLTTILGTCLSFYLDSNISGESCTEKTFFFLSDLKRRKSTFSIYVIEEKWSIQLLSVCHCQLAHQRASPCEARAVWHKEVEIFWVFRLPQEEALCQRTREKTLCGCKSCIFHHNFTWVFVTSVVRAWHS